MNKLKYLLLVIAISILSSPVYGHRRGGWRQANVDWTTYKDQSYVGGVPVAGLGRIYVNGKVIYFIDEDGTATSMIAGAGGGIDNVVEDLTPQLGGDLDLNGQNLDFPTTPNISDVLDEDNMASDSATMLATQQSIKAYVDAGAGAVNLNNINDPDGNTSINCDGFAVDFIFDDPAGAFEIKATGNYTSHGLLSVVQETGNPGDTHLVHVEAEDPDVLPLHIKKTDDSASIPLMECEGDRATPTDDDEIYHFWKLSDDAGNQDEMMRMSVVATDVSTTTEDASITWDLIQDGSLTEVAVLNSLGDLALNSVAVSNTGLHVLDTNASHDLIYKPGSDLTADRTLTTTTGDSDRTITLSGNPTLDDWFDQSVKSGTSPTFDGANITGVSASNVSIATGGGSPTIDQVQEYFDNTGSSGYFTGGALSDGGAGTLDVAAGEGFIRTTNDDNAELQSFKWSASAGIAVADDTTQYVYVDDSGVISLSTSEFLETPDKILIGVVTDEGAAIESVFQLGVRLQEGIGQAGRFMRGVHGIVRNKRVGGLIFGQSGDANRDVTMTTGQIEWGRTSYTMSAFDTSGADTFTTYSANGQEDATASQWPNAQYDNAGTLTTMTNNRWANLFFWLEPNDKIIMVYGRAEFVSQAGAEAEGVPSSSLPTRISETGLLATRFTFQKSANTATIESAFDTLFANAAVSDHANLATLAWTSAGHTGTASTFAGFNGGGAATEYTESNYLLTDGTRALAGAWSMGSQATTNVNIDSGTINGITDLAVVDGGTGASSLNNLITLTTHTTGNYSDGNAEAGDALVSIAVEITDNEATAEENPLVFVAGADPDGGDLPLETDGTCTYNPSTGEITTTGFVGALTGNSDTTTTASAGDAAVDFFGAGTDAVTDTTTCTDIEGTGLSITAGTLNATAHTPEGTAILSTGEAGATKFLREDGDNTCSWQTVTAGHADTITWSGTSILETGVAFQFGDASDATLTHTYANTGTNVSVAYSTAAMAVTGSLTATNLSGTNTGDEAVSDTTTQGIVEASIASEVTTGTDAARSVTPDSLAGSDYGKRIVSILLNDSTALTTANKGYLRLPSELSGWNLVGVNAAMVAGTGEVNLDLHNVTQADADILSTNLTIDANEIDSSTAATAAVIDTGQDDVTTADRYRIDVDAAGTGSTWVEFQMIFQLP